MYPDYQMTFKFLCKYSRNFLPQYQFLSLLLFISSTNIDKILLSNYQKHFIYLLYFLLLISPALTYSDPLSLTLTHYHSLLQYYDPHSLSLILTHFHFAADYYLLSLQLTLTYSDLH